MTDKKIEALKLALEAIEAAIKAGDWVVDGACDPDMAIHAIREALAEQPSQQDIPKIGCVNHDCDKCKAQQQEPELEPDAWDRCEGVDRQCRSWCGSRRCVSHWREAPPPASKPWVGLTDEEVIIMSRYDLEYAALIGEVQRKLKEKNT